MSLSRDEWADRVEAKKAERDAAHRPQLDMLRQAAVGAELLTGNEHWDRYLSYLQAAVEETERQREGFQAIVNDAKTVDHGQLLVAKLAMAECRARIEAWKVAMSLPRDLIAMGEQAKDLLERLPPIENGSS